VHSARGRRCAALIRSLASTRAHSVLDTPARWQRSAFDSSAVSHFSTSSSTAAAVPTAASAVSTAEAVPTAAVTASTSSGVAEWTDAQLEVRAQLKQVRGDLVECGAAIKKVEGQIEGVEAEMKQLTSAGGVLDAKTLEYLRAKEASFRTKEASLQTEKVSLRHQETLLLGQEAALRVDMSPQRNQANGLAVLRSTGPIHVAHCSHVCASLVSRLARDQSRLVCILLCFL
jgi:hypothetical protein